MNKILYSLLAINALIAGMLWYAWLHEWFIITYPHMTHNAQQQTYIKKRVALYYPQSDSVRSEYQELVYTADTATYLKNIVTAWLTAMHQEGIITKKITVSVCLGCAQQEAYVSFSDAFLPTQDSLFHQCLLIEGLLKSIREQISSLYKIHFLVNHEPMPHDQLDFTHPWLMNGYLPT
jgi:hypothetical protein